MQKRNFPKFVVTGGPCGGKTTGLLYIGEKLSNMGYYPLIAPETATILISSGITPESGAFTVRKFQERIIESQLFFEKLYEGATQEVNHSKPIVICDRGLMDSKAYMPGGMFESVFQAKNLEIPVVRDGRYDAVFHLRTAALGAEEFYTLENNKARRESAEEARDVDERTLQAWNGHSHLRVIDNSTEFDLKMKRLLAGMCRVLGEPVPLEIEKKFQIHPLDLRDLPVEVQEIDVEQFYLVSGVSNEEIRVRKRGQYGSFVYYKTTKKTVKPGVRIETEKQISAHEYEWSQEYQLANTQVIRKKRNCFIWKNQYFELDCFENRFPEFPEGLFFLEIELTEENDKVDMPEFISVKEEVTDDPAYSNFALAQQKSTLSS